MDTSGLAGQQATDGLAEGRAGQWASERSERNDQEKEQFLSCYGNGANDICSGALDTFGLNALQF